MTVFGTDYAARYDTLYAEKDYGAECDLIEAAARRFAPEGGRTVVDIGCGTGRHAIELARRGWDVSGVDRSPAMLALARARAAEAGLDVTFMEGDARAFDAGRQFDLALMMFAVAGYLGTADAVREAFANVQRQLVDGGLFVFDCWHGPAVLAERPGNRVRVLDGATSQTTRYAEGSLDEAQQLVTVRYRLVETRGDEVLSDTHEVHTMRYFFAPELRALLAEAGLELVSATAFPSLDAPLTDTDWNALFIARKR